MAITPEYTWIKIGTAAGDTLWIGGTVAPSGAAANDKWLDLNGGLHSFNGTTWTDEIAATAADLAAEIVARDAATVAMQANIAANTQIDNDMSELATQTATALGGTQQTVAGHTTSIGGINASLGTITANQQANQAAIASLLIRVAALETAPPDPVPNAPTALVHGTMTTTTAPLSWTGSTVGSPTSYVIQRSPTGANTWTDALTVVGAVIGTVTGLTPNTAYDFRVYGINATGPGPASALLVNARTTSSFTPSPAWTEITNNTGSITLADGAVWTIVDGVVMRDPGSGAVPFGTTALVILGLVNDAGVFYQENTYLGWWYAVAPSTWTETFDPRASPPVGVPAQAAAVGYNTVTFNADFDAAGEVVDYAASGAGAKFFSGGPDSGQRYTSPGDWAISSSILSLYAATGDASSVSTARNTSVPISSPSAHNVSAGDGVGFHYFYTEAKMRFNSGGSDNSGGGWTSWWGTCFHDRPGDQLEIDFMENQSPQAFNNGFINWFDGHDPALPYGQMWGALGADGYPDWGAVAAASGIDLNGGWNVFGCLWTPTEISFWWNSWARRIAGVPDTRVAYYPTTTPIHGYMNFLGAPYYGTIVGATNGNPIFLILGGNRGKSTQFDYVKVYQ